MSDHSDERSTFGRESDSSHEPVSHRESNSRIERWPTTRRWLLRATAAVGGLAAIGDPALAQESETIELGGETSGWQGVSPDEIEGETNPTLELETGTTYELTWENLDGQAHNVVIVDGDGEELERTELMTEEGETQTLEFEAASEMAEYYCEPHAATMRGDISIGGESDGESEDGSDDGQATAFFDSGPEIGLRTIAEGMTAPTDFAVAGEDDRYLIADQTGELWLVESDGLGEEPFLDVSDRLVELGTFEGSYADPNQDYDERGLLGVEVHPDFSENGRLFVHYSAPPNDETPEGWSHVEVVSEFQATDDLSDADPDSERVLMTFQKPQYNHDAGPMAFGPDGYLYVPMGDGGGANDDMEGHVDDWYDENDGGNGQDVSENLLGGIHRIDVDGENSETSRDDGNETAATEGDDQPYAIPDDNPLVDVDDARDEYYAWGFRNPFGISFDDEGRLFVSDAGQDLYEEANLVEAGGNYGWNVKEGTHCFSTDSPSDPPEDCPDSAPDDPPYDGQQLQDPIVEYPHVYEGEAVGITIIGGHVYEGDQLEELDSAYVFGDWTADPSRQEPAGRLLAAFEPNGGDDEVPADSEGNDSTDNETTDDEIASNESADNESVGNASEANVTAGNESVGNDSVSNGTSNDTADQDVEEEATEDTQDEPIDDENESANDTDAADLEAVPRDDLWTMVELQVSGTEDGSFPYFVRQFGQDDDGNVYVLANRAGVPEGDTGVVMEFVSPDDGEELSMPQDEDGESNESNDTGDTSDAEPGDNVTNESE